MARKDVEVMNLLDANVVKQIGYQMSPCIGSMSEYVRDSFEQTIATVMEKELKAIKVKAKMEEIKIAANLISCIAADSDQADLLKHYYKLSKELESL